MIAVVQRVTRASVAIADEVIGRIGEGLVVLVGISDDDTEADGDLLAAKIINLRIFNDADGKMNKSVLEMNAGLLIISQFTLLADCRKGRRPSFHRAAAPELAVPLYERFVEACEASGLLIARGVFQAEMTVEIHNDGPVTLIIDSFNRRGNKPGLKADAEGPVDE